jgi:hypothetical protein
MQPLIEAAHLIAQEIERTRQHLANLEQALEGLKPLITIDAATATLPYASTTGAQPIEDVSIVQERNPTAGKSKPKVKITNKAAKAKSLAKTTELPSTGAELWLACFGRKKLGLGELVDAAMLKLELDESARAVITNRAGAWLYAAVKKGVLVPAGTRDGTKLFKRVPPTAT